MDDVEFDRGMVAAGLAELAEHGWHGLSVAAAARRAELPLDRARLRFPGRLAILSRLGRMADAAALAELPGDGPVRDRLFHLLMRRIDVFATHRDGVIALLRALPLDPSLALFLGCATRRSMRWMLDAAGVPTGGLRGELRVKGLVAVWLWTLRAWERDESTDLAATMAALDAALARAEQAAGWLGGGSRHVAAEEPAPPPPEAGAV
ncbi:MAG: TetR family transcriptional regulator [Rhodospirillales bacterium]|nr:TetR family transcriptional regulator [Rhodospirillales bacterium]